MQEREIPLGVPLARRAEKRARAGFGGDERRQHRPPRDAPSAQREIVQAFLAPTHVQAHRIEHGGDADSLAHVLDRLMLGGTGVEQGVERAFDVRHAPVGHRAFFLGIVRVGRGEAELVTAHVETDVKRLVEIRREAKLGAPPCFGFIQIRDVINLGA